MDNVKAAQAVRDIAAALGATPAQVALAWLLQQGPDIVPIPGTKRRRYLEENVAAADLTLDAAQLKVLDAALAPGKVAGLRYGEMMMGLVDR
jgi:aryl-alcohol dehydrogenase-like predicted oxidoreductase